MIKSLARLFHIIAILFVATALAAEERELKTDTTEAVDAVLVLDSSGSMLLNDPLRLRYEGARLFLQFLKPGDRLAVVTFAEQATIARPLTSFEPSQSDAVSQLLGQLQATGQYTDILSGIRTAAEILHSNPNTNAKPLIVLLSDGKMDPAPASGSADDLTDKLMNDVLPDLKAQGMRVYTLAFSEEADKALLSQVAASTDGVQWFTPNADKVHESFAELFLAVKKPQVLPLSAKGFVIDGDVQEATFYVNRDPDADVYLKAPAGTEIRSNSSDPSIKWFRGQKFDVVTITKPEIGTWQLFGVSPNEGFATILTNLKLVSDWESYIEAGSTALLQARLYEDKKPISLPEMTGASRFAFQITPTDKVAEPIVREFLVDDGTHGDKIAGDGIFSYEISLDEPGEYRLRILAKAPTFERQQQIPFRVRPPLITIAIESGHGDEHEDSHGSGDGDAEHANVEEKDAHHDSHHESHHTDEKASHDTHEGKSGHGESEQGTEQSRIVIRLSEEALALRNVQVKLTAVDSNRQRFSMVPKKGHGSLEYDVSAAALPSDGTYSLIATLTAEAKQRKTFKQDSKPLVFTRTSTGAEPPEVMVQVVEEKEPESFPLVELLIVTLVNVLSIGLAFVMIKKLKGGTTEAEPIPPIPDSIFQSLAELEKKLGLTEIDLSDPIFSESGSSDEVTEQPPASAADTGESSDAAEPSEASAAQAPSEAAEEQASQEEVQEPEPAGEEEAPAEEQEEKTS